MRSRTLDQRGPEGRSSTRARRSANTGITTSARPCSCCATGGAARYGPLHRALVAARTDGRRAPLRAHRCADGNRHHRACRAWQSSRGLKRRRRRRSVTRARYRLRSKLSKLPAGEQPSGSAASVEEPAKAGERVAEPSPSRHGIYSRDTLHAREELTCFRSCPCRLCRRRNRRRFRPYPRRRDRLGRRRRRPCSRSRLDYRLPISAPLEPPAAPTERQSSAFHIIRCSQLVLTEQNVYEHFSTGGARPPMIGA
jgi:hypothetical protein